MIELVIGLGMFILSIFLATFLAMLLALWLWDRLDGKDRRPGSDRGMFDED